MVLKTAQIKNHKIRHFKKPTDKPLENQNF